MKTKTKMGNERQLVAGEYSLGGGLAVSGMHGIIPYPSRHRVQDAVRRIRSFDLRTVDVDSEHWPTTPQAVGPIRLGATHTAIVIRAWSVVTGGRKWCLCGHDAWDQETERRWELTIIRWLVGGLVGRYCNHGIDQSESESENERMNE